MVVNVLRKLIENLLVLILLHPDLFEKHYSASILAIRGLLLILFLFFRLLMKLLYLPTQIV